HLRSANNLANLTALDDHEHAKSPVVSELRRG
ncbi:MAG: hypothetical protein QOK27_293, partial [Gemmatimonadales bacterium]|nr:hypothetical protein [Gemmatimonadales bacterium]